MLWAKLIADISAQNHKLLAIEVNDIINRYNNIETYVRLPDSLFQQNVRKQKEYIRAMINLLKRADRAIAQMPADIGGDNLLDFDALIRIGEKVFAETKIVYFNVAYEGNRQDLLRYFLMNMYLVIKKLEQYEPQLRNSRGA